jgi:hypothetical protein
VDVKTDGQSWYLFYEFARADGSHDMRVVPCDAAALRALVS